MVRRGRVSGDVIGDAQDNDEIGYAAPSPTSGGTLVRSKLAAAIATAVLTALLAVPMSAAAAWNLSPGGLGPITIGMSPAEVQEATGLELADFGPCAELVGGPRGLTLVYGEDGSVEFVTLDRTSKLTTTRGVRVRDRTSKIFKVYGARARRLPEYNDEVGQGPDVLYTPPGSGFRIVFWTYRKRVVLIAAGRTGVEKYVEFCA